MVQLYALLTPGWPSSHDHLTSRAKIWYWLDMELGGLQHQYGCSREEKNSACLELTLHHSPQPSPGVHKSLVSQFCTVAPNICVSSVWDLFYIILLVPRILIWYVYFWKIFGPSDCCIDVTDFMVLEHEGLHLSYVRGLNPSGGEIFITIQTSLGPHPVSCTTATGFLSRG